MPVKRSELALCAVAFSALMITSILPIVSSNFIYAIVYILSYALPVILVMIGNKSAGHRLTFIDDPRTAFSITPEGVYLCGIFFTMMLAFSIIINIVLPSSAPSHGLTLFSFTISGILAPILEELFWRGTVFYSLAYNGTFQAMVISSVLFGMLHSTTAGMMYAAFSGMLFSYMYARTGSLLPCILLHMANNISSLLTPFFPYIVYILLALGIISSVCVKLYQKSNGKCMPKAKFIPDKSDILKSPFLYAALFILIMLKVWR